MSSKISIGSIIALLLTLVGMNISLSNRTSDSFTLMNDNIGSVNETIAKIGTTQLNQGKVIAENKDKIEVNRQNLEDHRQDEYGDIKTQVFALTKNGG
jgi:hypothetical protein